MTKRQLLEALQNRAPYVWCESLSAYVAADKLAFITQIEQLADDYEFENVLLSKPQYSRIFIG